MLTHKQRNKLINLVRTWRVQFTHDFINESLKAVSDSRLEIVTETYKLLDDAVSEDDRTIFGILRLLRILRHVDGNKTLLSALERLSSHDSQDVRDLIKTICSQMLQHDAESLSKDQRWRLCELQADA